jgi:hypothetical protein
MTEELTMRRGIVVGLAVLVLSTSAALAAHRTHHHHHQAMEATAPSDAGPAPGMWMGGVNSGDHAMYLQNLHDSGYNPKNDFVNGNMRTQ